MSTTGAIDTSDSTPTLNVARIAATALGTVIWGYVNGLLGFARRLFGGVFSTVDDVAAWLQAPPGDGLIPTLLAVPVNVLEAGATANAAFLSGLGMWGQLVAVLEGMAVLLLIILAIETAASKAVGAL